MTKITFDKLCEKEVINSCDCSRLGTISDMVIDIECGKILSFSVCPESTSFYSHKSSERIIIHWERICKIGEDIILVDIPPVPKQVCDREKDKKRFFS